jgi:late competence protein required for DNA uptake (superfamily II DNA/RNA helicase)
MVEELHKFDLPLPNFLLLKKWRKNKTNESLKKQLVERKKTKRQCDGERCG